MHTNSPANNVITATLISYFEKNAPHYRIEMVFLCGSHSGGLPHPDSDIDLGIVFSEAVLDHAIMHTYITELSAALSHKLKKEVDAFAITSDFAHPMLFYNAIISGIPVLIENQKKFLRLKLDAIHQMEDFTIFGPKWQHTIAKNLLGNLQI